MKTEVPRASVNLMLCGFMSWGIPDLESAFWWVGPILDKAGYNVWHDLWLVMAF